MSNKYKLLIIEDEVNISNFIKTTLESHDYQVLTAYNGGTGRMLFLSHSPDLIILDLGLPDEDGIEYIHFVRETSTVPILVLSARTNEIDKVEALDAGANDYVTKPFGTAELMARIRVILRNRQNGTHTPNKKTFTAADLTIDYEKRRLYTAGQEIKLTRTEYNIVAFLSEHAGRVLTYEEIIRHIWNWSDSGSIKKLQVNMASIRKKLGEKPGENKYIFNELGVGYRMTADTDKT